jgi:hypothetical protein
MGNNIDYDLDALREGLVKCDKNIQVFEDAIVNEQKTKSEYRRMISVLEEKKARENDDQNGRNN